MRLLAKKASFAKAIACGVILLLSVLSAWQLRAQSPNPQYSRMAPVEQYLMDRNAEIALARSAAPDNISRDATVLVLARHGYETAVEGKNGFVCMVERGWVASFDLPEMWNPKIRGADCLNPPAVRSILPIVEMRTNMVMAGRSQTEIVAAVRAALIRKKLPALEPGAMGYMMSRGSYLTDDDSHNVAHLMFFMPIKDPAIWGADLQGSPIASASFWFSKKKTSQELKGFPPLLIFVVAVPEWSDGTAAPLH